MKYDSRLKELEARQPADEEFEIHLAILDFDWTTGLVWEKGYCNLTTGERVIYPDDKIVKRSPDPEKMSALYQAYLNA